MDKGETQLIYYHSSILPQSLLIMTHNGKNWEPPHQIVSESLIQEEVPNQGIFCSFFLAWLKAGERCDIIRSEVGGSGMLNETQEPSVPGRLPDSSQLWCVSCTQIKSWLGKTHLISLAFLCCLSH